MAEKGFGVKEVNLIGASGTPTITSPNNLNLNAVNVAISTNASIGGNLTVTGNIGIAGTNAVKVDLLFSDTNVCQIPNNNILKKATTYIKPTSSPPLPALSRYEGSFLLTFISLSISN